MHTHIVRCQDSLCWTSTTGTPSSMAASTTSTPFSTTTTNVLLKTTQTSRPAIKSDNANANTAPANLDDNSTHVSEYYPLVAMICVAVVVIVGIVGGIVFVLVRKTVKRSERNYQPQYDTDGGDDILDGLGVVEGQVVDVIDGSDVHGLAQTDDSTF